MRGQRSRRNGAVAERPGPRLHRSVGVGRPGAVEAHRQRRNAGRGRGGDDRLPAARLPDRARDAPARDERVVATRRADVTARERRGPHGGHPRECLPAERTVRPVPGGDALDEPARKVRASDARHDCRPVRQHQHVGRDLIGVQSAVPHGFPSNRARGRERHGVPVQESPRGLPGDDEAPVRRQGRSAGRRLRWRRQPSGPCATTVLRSRGRRRRR